MLHDLVRWYLSIRRFSNRSYYDWQGGLVEQGHEMRVEALRRLA